MRLTLSCYTFFSWKSRLFNNVELITRLVGVLVESYVPLCHIDMVNVGLMVLSKNNLEYKKLIKNVFLLKVKEVGGSFPT